MPERSVSQRTVSAIKVIIKSGFAVLDLLFSKFAIKGSMNKFVLISSLILLMGMTLLVNPQEIKMTQLTVILVLIFFFLMSVIDIIAKYILGSGTKSTIIVLVSTLYIWSTLAMNSVGSGSIKDIVIFSLVFLIAFFYVRNNFIATKQ